MFKSAASFLFSSDTHTYLHAYYGILLFSPHMADMQLKVKAIFLILLMAGSEAARIKQAANGGGVVDLDDPDDVSVEQLQPESEEAVQRLKQLNKQHCRWRSLRGGCTGEGCRWRPLPLDRTMSDSCRLSDVWMRSEENVEVYSSLQSEQMKEKSLKFQGACSKDVQWRKMMSKEQWRCYRRAGYMMQASQFLLKAQTNATNQAETVRAKVKDNMDAAMGHIADSLGEDAPHYMMLKQKVESNTVELMKTPYATLKDIIGKVRALGHGNETTKLEVKRAIEAMPSGTGAAPTYEDEEQLKKGLAELVPEAKKLQEEHGEVNASANDLINSVEKMLPQTGHEDNDAAASATASALIEATSETGNMSLLEFLLLVLVFAIVWSIINALFGSLGIWGVFGGSLTLLLKLIVIIAIFVFVMQPVYNKMQGTVFRGLMKSRGYGGKKL